MKKILNSTLNAYRHYRAAKSKSKTYKIVRYSITAVCVAYLLTIRLAPTPCLIAKVAPGPGQNDAAREAADGGTEGCVQEIR